MTEFTSILTCIHIGCKCSILVAYMVRYLSRGTSQHKINEVYNFYKENADVLDITIR